MLARNNSLTYILVFFNAFTIGVFDSSFDDKVGYQNNNQNNNLLGNNKPIPKKVKKK